MISKRMTGAPMVLLSYLYVAVRCPCPRKRNLETSTQGVNIASAEEVVLYKNDNCFCLRIILAGVSPMKNLRDRVRCAWSKYPKRLTTSRIETPSLSKIVAYRARSICLNVAYVTPVDRRKWRCTERKDSSPGRRAKVSSTIGSRERMPDLARRPTKVSALLKLGYSTAEPFSQKERPEAGGSVTSL